MARKSIKWKKGEGKIELGAVTEGAGDQLTMRSWQVLSQGYAQSMALTGLRSKNQSPTDSAIFCNIEKFTPF